MCKLECQLECRSGSCERCRRLHLSTTEMRAPCVTHAPPRQQRRRHVRATRTHTSQWLICAASVVRWADTCGRTLSRKRLGGLLLVLTLLLTMGLSPRAEAVVIPSNDYQLAVNETSPQERKVCQSIDIRNSVSEFSNLQGCHIVEGFVQILLIERDEIESFNNISFPELVEITGYLMLYRVNGLRNLTQLFPNLSVIRGHSLFINYALVAFEMMNLQEIGLYSLTDIVRGAVRFEKNPALCHVDTIDWDLIASSGIDEHVIRTNNQKNVCPICDKNCPVKATQKDETMCWNKRHCQKVCPQKCNERACDDKGACCHPLCIGGCTGPTSKDCKVCKDVVVGNNECVEKCPPNTFEFMNRRCITEDECRKMPRPRESVNTDPYPYKPFNFTCMIECPPGYMEAMINNKSTCKQCEGQCLKACPGVNVDSVATAQKLRGCTHITGSLEIQVSGGRNVVKELEENLGDIEIIDGYLKVVRSFPLVSLNFLRNLKEIRGISSDNAIYTLLVLDNQNLMELWNWEKHPKIKIFNNGDPHKPGKLFFHFNPKLCLDRIDKLKSVCGLQKHSDDIDVSPSTNGDKAACNVTELDVKVVKKAPEAALIHWPGFKHHDPRGILGYVVYFIEAPSQNVTMYDGRDACGGDGWKVDDVSLSETTDNSLQGDSEPMPYAHIMTQLKPYTQYAFYVKTYTIASIKAGAQSKVKYFTTLPGVPNPPRGLSIYSNSSDSLVISWSPPLQPNGNLTYYYIKGKWNEYDNTFLHDRDYCEDPMLLTEKKSMMEMAEEERKKAHLEREMVPKIMEPSRSCDCADREPNKSQQEKEVSSSIAFEDALHNQVYIKRTNSRPRRDVPRDLPYVLRGIRKRDAHSYADEKDIVDVPPKQIADTKKFEGDKILDGVYISFARNVSSRNLTFVMRGLKHFGSYNIEIQACRDRLDDPNDVTKTCSTTSVRTYRTLPKENADNIPTGSFQIGRLGNNTQTIMKLTWHEPERPNGLIVSYQIEYKRVDIQNVQPTTICIPRDSFKNNTFVYYLKGLSAGNYSVRVRASSFAGNGAYTPAQYFQIEEYVEGHTFWTIFSVTMVLVVIGVMVLVFLIRKKIKNSVPSMRLIATVNPEYVGTAYFPDEWEVPREKVAVMRELGNGSFGMVYEGVAENIVEGKPEVRCAVKTVNEQATDRERVEFLNEASVMKAFNTHHVVRLLGVVSKGQPTLVVMELMTNGDLKSYLRSHRPDACENQPATARTRRQPPTLKRILRMAVEIADGMCYLSAKKFVHRDLAARNCMVAEDLTVKIGDFGMTRDIYETDYYRKGSKGLLPVRWMAPESLMDGVFTSASDVWSYGVVLWEMATLASQPYQGLSNDQVLHYVLDGGVMERPENCPDSLYMLMRLTWNHKATNRPTFIDLETMLLHEVQEEDFERVSFYHSLEGIEARNQNAAHSIARNETTEIDITTLQELREEEMEMDEEDSPLHPNSDGGDFTSMVPIRQRNHLNSIRYEDELERLDENNSKTPLKAAFDDFDGALGDSLSSSKDTLDLPYAEDSLKSSTRSSPCTRRQKSISPKSASPQSIRPADSPSAVLSNLTPNREEPDYENRNPEMRLPENDVTSLKMIPRREIDEREPEKRTGSLNNGYISGATAK